ncbi:MAG TPA: prepilin-type N-terminal cleavage/methylation domain-containing protein [Blastocatellia bacterium]|nr:prepilin-type N-terminal cleavage/methylation domain-containing protein [Blastocatellia bacterium]
MFRQARFASSDPHDRGFSVIEMAVVLLIIAVVAAFVVPQVVAYMRSYRLGVAARNVATAVQRARYLATSNNTRAGISVAELQRVDIEQYDPAEAGAAQNKGAVRLPEGITIASDAPRQISFDGRGVVTPMPRENAAIRINGANGYYQIVTVSPTGQVTLSGTLQEGKS